MAGEYVTAAKASEIPVGSSQAVQVKGQKLLICHIEGGFYAVDDTCTHDDGPLADGWLDGRAIECPRHGARFDVTTGTVLCLPAAVPIRTYEVNVEGEQILVKV